jgi:hypothetical protein
MAAEVIGKPDAWLPDAGVFVVETGRIERASDSREAEFTDALGIKVGLPCGDRQGRIGVAGVAECVVGCAEKFVAETEVESKRLADPVIILREPGIAGNAVVMVAQASTALA